MGTYEMLPKITSSGRWIIKGIAIFISSNSGEQPTIRCKTKRSERMIEVHFKDVSNENLIASFNFCQIYRGDNQRELDSLVEGELAAFGCS